MVLSSNSIHMFNDLGDFRGQSVEFRGIGLRFGTDCEGELDGRLEVRRFRVEHPEDLSEAGLVVVDIGRGKVGGVKCGILWSTERVNCMR